MMEPGAIVNLHLMNPAEKYWGVLEAINPAGVVVRGINLSSFDDWTGAVASEQEPDLGLTTVFFPMLRVERMFLDEPVGAVESLCQIFERRVGRSVHDVLGQN